MRFVKLGLAFCIVLSLIFTISITTIPKVESQDIGYIVLSNVELVTVTEDYAAITWDTNLPANTAVEWGETDELGEENVVPESTLYHMAMIDDLKRDTEYYYRVGSDDRWTEVASFITLANPEDELELTFAIVADTHYDVDGVNAPNGMMYDDSVVLTDALVEELNQDTSLDFVVTAGDLTNVGVEEDYAGFVDSFSNLNVPWYPTLGNHDKSSPDWYQYYMTYIGMEETYYSFDQKNYHFVILDSAVQGEVKGDLNDTQLAWLEADLDLHAGKPTLIFMHHINHRVDIMGLDEEAKAKLDAIISNRSWVLSIHSGHSHQNEVILGDNGQVYATTAAVVSYPIGYSKVNLYDGGFTQAFYKIESELEISEESRRRINAASGSTSGDEDCLGELYDRSFVINLPAISPNRPPVIAYLTAEPDSVRPGGASVITVSATDPDNDNLTYTYRVSAGSIEGSGYIITYYAPTEAGKYRVFVTVSDGEFTSPEKSIEIEVTIPQVNHMPKIKEVWNSKSLVDPKEEVDIRVKAFDEDDDTLTYHYEPSGGTISGSGDEVTWQAPDKAGKYTISIWVSDWEQSSEKSSITIEVKDKKETEPGLVTPGFEGFILILSAILVIYIRFKKK